MANMIIDDYHSADYDGQGDRSKDNVKKLGSVIFGQFLMRCHGMGERMQGSFSL